MHLLLGNLVPVRHKAFVLGLHPANPDRVVRAPVCHCAQEALLEDFRSVRVAPETEAEGLGRDPLAASAPERPALREFQKRNLANRYMCVNRLHHVAAR